MSHRKAEGSELSVFKGREARLNLALFESLSFLHPQTIKDLQKKISKKPKLQGVYYASLSKRISCLEETGYLKKAKIDSRAAAYELRPKAYLAMLLESFSPEDLLDRVTDKSASILLLAILNVILSSEEYSTETHKT